MNVKIENQMADFRMPNGGCFIFNIPYELVNVAIKMNFRIIAFVNRKSVIRHFSTILPNIQQRAWYEV